MLCYQNYRLSLSYKSSYLLIINLISYSLERLTKQSIKALLLSAFWHIPIILDAISELSPTGNNNSSSDTTSLIPGKFETRTGFPHAMTSTADKPNPSQSEL